MDRTSQHPAQPQSQPPSSGVTAIIAGILAVLGGLYDAFGLFGLIVFFAIPIFAPPSEYGWSFAKLQLLLIVTAAFAILLLIGGILMLIRKKFARVLLGVGGVGTLVQSIIITSIESNTITVNTDLDAVSAVGIVLNIVMLVLTFLPTTSRWLTYRPITR
ncbi:hypothetical protein [Nocardia gipuzkoensis]|uniref:hypothetical protein n=1 Tax=Nocardia gipuzkoensis TaxID=2749991 RepID=UPI0015EFA9E8|nr:hypothetical protein [Nocardia gipuzkoensis]